MGKSTISMGHGFHSYASLPESIFQAPIVGWLVVGHYPSEKDEFVNGKDDIPYMK